VEISANGECYLQLRVEDIAGLVRFSGVIGYLHLFPHSLRCAA
jgi:hypothetical protein